MFKKYKNNLTTQIIDGESFLSSFGILVAKIDIANQQIIQYESFDEKIQNHIDYTSSVMGMPIVKKF
jgi:hypothetical protein